MDAEQPGPEPPEPENDGPSDGTTQPPEKIVARFRPEADLVWTATVNARRASPAYSPLEQALLKALSKLAEPAIPAQVAAKTGLAPSRPEVATEIEHQPVEDVVTLAPGSHVMGPGLVSELAFSVRFALVGDALQAQVVSQYGGELDSGITLWPADALDAVYDAIGAALLATFPHLFEETEGDWH